jgi:hypothetical protein
LEIIKQDKIMAKKSVTVAAMHTNEKMRQCLISTPKNWGLSMLSRHNEVSHPSNLRERMDILI